MQLIRQLPLSLAFVVLSTVVNAVPIQSDPTVTIAAVSMEEDNVVWVTETYWPCEAPASRRTADVALATATGVKSVSRGTVQKKADYDTVPVDGSDNSEAVPQEEAASSVVDVAAQTTEDTQQAITPTTVDPESIGSPTVTETPADSSSSEILVYTLVHSSTSSADPISSETKLDAEFTVISFHTPSPVATTKSPAAYNANTTITTPPVPTMPIILLPTYASSNGTDGSNKTCTDLGEPDEYTPEEESAYWATATEPSFYYSDYTVMVTLKSTSMVTVSNTAAADAVETSTTVTTTTTSSAADTASSIMPFANSTKTYTLAGVSRAAVTGNSDPSTSETIITSHPATTPMATPTAAVDSAAEETISGTIMTYVDETTTTTLASSTTTITETVSATDVTSSADTGDYDTTTTTTDIITSTIIVEETAAAKKLRRGILVTRS